MSDDGTFWKDDDAARAHEEQLATHADNQLSFFLSFFK